jgi:hypothetical protein
MSPNATAQAQPRGLNQRHWPYTFHRTGELARLNHEEGFWSGNAGMIMAILIFLAGRENFL